MIVLRVLGWTLCVYFCAAVKRSKGSETDESLSSISTSDSAVGGIQISHPAVKNERPKLAYGARRSASDYLATFDDNTVQNLVPCSHYKNDPGTCIPFAEHSPCVYCKVQQKNKVDLKWFGKINLWKDRCPDSRAFPPGITGYRWRLTERKFAGDIRVCVVEEELLDEDDNDYEDDGKKRRGKLGALGGGGGSGGKGGLGGADNNLLGRGPSRSGSFVWLNFTLSCVLLHVWLLVL